VLEFACLILLTLPSSLALQLSKEVEDAKGEKDRVSSEVESLQMRLNLLQTKLEGDTRKYEEQIQKLQQQLVERPLRRKVVPPSVPEGSPSLPSVLSTAPTAAVKPTVTTTPTASIRPMAIQVTSAPTAHVTPTMVTQHVAPSTTQLSSINSTAAAAVFVRSSSQQVTPTPSSVVSSASGSVSMVTTTTTSVSPVVAIPQSVEHGGERRGERAVKRRREEQQEPGSSLEPPATKRSRHLAQPPELEPTPTSAMEAQEQPVQTSDEVGSGALAMDTQVTESQVLVPETQTGTELSSSSTILYQDQGASQSEINAVPETQSIEVTQTTSEMEVSRALRDP